MTRTDFVNALFDNGNCLSLEQIRNIEKVLPGTIPADMPLDEGSLMTARDVFFSDLHDCSDLLEIQDYMKNNFQEDLTDMQIYRLSYIRGI